MTQKQTVGVVVGVALVVVVCVFVYRQYANDEVKTGAAMQSGTVMTPEKKASVTSAEKKSVPVPDTIDGIAGSIISETSVDAMALDDEEKAALDDVTEDSNSVTNLGTSYDENNL